MKLTSCQVLAAGCLVAASARAGDPPIEIIAAPGGSFGTTNTAFTTARINAGGQVQFVARIPDLPDPTYSANYVGVPGMLTLIAREGPFDSGTTYLSDIERSYSPINDLGQVLIQSQRGGLGINFDNDYQITLGGALCAREQDVAPDTGGLLFRSLYDQIPYLNNLGTMAFMGVLENGTPTDMDTGIWVGTTGGTSLHAREGDAAPGMGPGVAFFLFDGIGGINDADQILFRARMTGTGIDSSNDYGLWLGTPGAPALVAREGDPVPGIAGDVKYGNFSPWSALNDAGQLAFFTLLTGADVMLETNNCIVTGTIGNLSMAIRTGDVAPGTGGAVFSFFDAPVIDGGGRISFRANLTGPGIDSTNDRGIWTGLPGALTLVAREGGTPPGGDPGDVYTFLYHPVMNAQGQVAFGGTYDDGVGSRAGIWATDTNGVLTEVMRYGDIVDIGGGDLRTVRSPELAHRSNFGSGGQDGRARSFNDAGQIAFDLTFDDFQRAIVRTQVGDGGPAPCPIDTDGSSDVGINDFLAVLAQWGSVCPCTADVSGPGGLPDGMVGISDFLAVLASWGVCP